MLRDPAIDRVAEASSDSVERDAAFCGVSSQDFDIQLRLHLPKVLADFPTGAAENLYAAVRPILLSRCSIMSSYMADAALRANASLLLGQETTRRDYSLQRPDGRTIGMRFGTVPPRIGHFYQAKLHYMMSPRADSLVEMGCFLQGATHPITYLAFSPCDRPYIIQSLRRHGLSASRSNVLVLTRALGLSGTAFNLMSFTLGRAARNLRDMGCRFIVTAFNPMLGFSGTALQATNFIPVATAPVACFYDDHGRYVTRRHSSTEYSIVRPAPGYRNLLAVIGVDRKARKELKQVNTLDHLDEADHDFDGAPHNRVGGELMDRLPEYRKRLETAWSKRTVHPSYAKEPLSSKGQCGVSSVWLAQLLRMKEIEATYCYGNLFFDDPAISPVEHHCWIEVGSSSDPDRQVIDLTCDQADGFNQTIICEPYSRLAANGIRYEPEVRLGVDDLPKDRVWRRFTYLEDSMRDKWGINTLKECTGSAVGS